MKVSKSCILGLIFTGTLLSPYACNASQTNDSAKIIMKSNVQKINGVNADFVLFEETPAYSMLRLTLGGKVADYQSKVTVTAFSPEDKAIPLKFVVTAAGANGGPTCGFYDLNLKQGIKLGYAIVMWNGESRKFRFGPENARDASQTNDTAKMFMESDFQKFNGRDVWVDIFKLRQGGPLIRLTIGAEETNSNSIRVEIGLRSGRSVSAKCLGSVIISSGCTFVDYAVDPVHDADISTARVTWKKQSTTFKLCDTKN
jgi:hypothetical protein